jgi:hypothetical protein
MRQAAGTLCQRAGVTVVARRRRGQSSMEAVHLLRKVARRTGAALPQGGAAVTAGAKHWCLAGEVCAIPFIMLL